MNSNLHIISQTCLMQQARKRARLLTSRFEKHLKPTGLTGGQFSSLVAISISEPISIVDLADRLSMDRTTLTRNLEPLKRKKFIKTLLDPEDGRKRMIAMTSIGKKVLERALPLWRRAQEETQNTDDENS